MTNRILLFLLALSLISCGKEVGRIDFIKVTTADKNFNKDDFYYPLETKELDLMLTKGQELSFWTELDMEYEGEAKVGFNCEFINNDSILFKFGVDPMEVNPKFKSIETSFNGKHSKSYYGKMEGFLAPYEDLDITVRATLVSTANTTLNIEKISFIIKE